MDSKTVQQQQTDLFSKRLTFFHRAVAIVFTIVLFAAILSVQRPWDEPQYSLDINNDQLLIQKLQSQFDKVFIYLRFADKITKTAFLLKNKPKQLSQSFPSSLSISQPVYRCNNQQSACLTSDSALNLQQKFIKKNLNETLNPLLSMMQCIQGQCFDVNGLGMLSRFLWQYRLNDFLIIDHIYIATKLSNQTQWNLAVYPIIGTQLNEAILSFDVNQENWNLYNVSRQATTHLYLGKLSEVQTAGIKYQYKIIAHLNSQILEKSIQNFAVNFFQQTQESNFRITQEHYKWLNYQFQDDITFPRNPTDPLLNTLCTINWPHDSQRSIISFNISRYQQEYLQAKTVEPHFSVYLTIIPLIIVVLIFHFQEQNVRNYILANFSKMANILNLYKYNINEIFSQRKCKSTLVIQSGQIFDLYQKLSEMPAQNLGFNQGNNSKIQIVSNRQQKKQLFKFDWILKKIANKFKDYCRPILQEKNKEIMNNKFSINSSVNQICQNEAKNLKQHFLRAKDLGLIQPFFKFAYLSLLKTPEVFDQILAEDVSPLPYQIVNLFRKINHTVRSEDIRRAFRFHNIQPSVKKLKSNKSIKKLRSKAEILFNKTQKQLTLNRKNEQDTVIEGASSKSLKKRISGVFQLKRVFDSTEEELQIRVQCNLLLKFLTILKDLDIHYTNAKLLNLEKQIMNLDESIENLRYLLGKNNKNIRTYYK